MISPDTFTRHQIDRPIPVESLVKCRMQDNLAFLQWSKKHWDQYFPGGDYDALARRKASGPTGAAAPAAGGRTSSAAATHHKPANTGAVRSRIGAGGAAGGGIGGGGGGGAQTAALTQEIKNLNETVTGLEKERDFYFSKLRDIELLIQNAVELDPKIEEDEEGLVKQIQAILYSTEVCLLPFPFSILQIQRV